MQTRRAGRRLSRTREWPATKRPAIDWCTSSQSWQLALVLLTALSWFGLGAWYGWGYCPWTDWRCQVRVRLCYDVPPSCTQLLIREKTGVRMDPLANVLTLVTLVAAGMLGLVLQIRNRPAIRNRRRARAGEPER